MRKPDELRSWEPVVTIPSTNYVTSHYSKTEALDMRCKKILV